MQGGSLTFVGFGFGPIQSGLFAFEAWSSGRFERIVVAEVATAMTSALAKHRHYGVNVASRDGIRSHTVGPIEALDPNRSEDRERLIEAISAASEVATAVPSVAFYHSESPGSIDRLIAAAIERRTQPEPLIIYAAENHTRAAALLREAVASTLPAKIRGELERRACFLDTVIGKMSGVIADPQEMQRLELAPLWPGATRAHLVEEFHRILVSRPPQGPGGERIARGLDVFEEKDDLHPFEEAKLYGHNATHALLAFLAEALATSERGRPERMSELADLPDAVELARAAFIEESGRALIGKYEGLDPLFTPAGWRASVDDLIERMLNPWLVDRVERVGRDPARKLGWSDRLAGTMRLALERGIEPHRFALGAAFALRRLGRERGEAKTWRERPERALEALDAIWEVERPDPRIALELRRLVEKALERASAIEATGRFTG